MPRRLMLNAALLAGMFLPSLSDSAEFRLWTDRRGRKVEATFVSWEGETIRFKSKSGKTYRLKLSSLSRKDREFLVSPKTVAVEEKLVDPDYLFALPIVKNGRALGGLLLADDGRFLEFQTTEGELFSMPAKGLKQKDRARLESLRKPKAADGPAKITSIKGTCTWGGRKSTWSADLTARGHGAYDAVYVSSWGGKPLNYVGTIKTDLKTKISGSGKASGGSANGSFEFSGKYGADGIAKCSYWEVGGRRNRRGSMTAERPK